MTDTIKCPYCGSQARIQGVTMETCAYYPIIFDEKGNITSRDGNISTTDWTCGSCGRTYTTKEQFGEIIEIVKGGSEMTLTAEQVSKLEELGFVHMKLSWHKTYRNNSYVRIDDRGLDYYIDNSWKAESDLAELRKVGLE